MMKKKGLRITPVLNEIESDLLVKSINSEID